MLLAKIKEALSSLYEDIQETEETPEPAETEAVAADTAAAEEVQAEETTSEHEESKAEEAEEPEEPAPPPGPRETDYATKGYHLDVELPPEKLPEAAEILLREDFFIESITGFVSHSTFHQRRLARPLEPCGKSSVSGCHRLPPPGLPGSQRGFQNCAHR